MPSTLLLAIRGTRIDYTTAPVGRAVVMLAVPMVMEMAMESIFAVADVFWVAHLGADAVATVGLTESMMTMIYTVAMGLSIGATALVARRIGEHDAEGAARAAGQSIVLGVVDRRARSRSWRRRSRRRCCALMGATDGGPTGSGFTRVMLGGNATVVLLFLMNAVFRGAGDAADRDARAVARQRAQHRARARASSSASARFRSSASPARPSRPTSGRGTAVVYQIVTLVRGRRPRARCARRHLRLDLSMMRSVLRLSGSGTFQILIGTASYVGAGADPVASSAAPRSPATRSASA